MTSDFEVLGAEQLERLSRRLRDAGDRELRKQLLAGIRRTNKPTIDRIRESAGSGEYLPQSGGFAALVAASKFGTRTRLTTKEVGVEIKGTGRSVRGIRALNDGRLRHPLFGNRSHWYQQAVRPGWFSDPIKKDLPQIRDGIQQAMNAIAEQLTRRGATS